MATIKFTRALKRFYPSLEPMELVDDVRTVVEQLDIHYQGLRDYIVDEQGILRKHVNIFVDGSMINDREQLSDLLKPNSEVYIMQALSGG
ncbi:MAG: MoaD/ThiS family protein [Bacteroidota bacterium]